MSRFPLIDVESANDPQVRQVYDEIIGQLGFGMVPNLFKSMAGRPGFLSANWNKFRSTILQGQLPGRSKR